MGNIPSALPEQSYLNFLVLQLDPAAESWICSAECETEKSTASAAAREKGVLPRVIKLVTRIVRVDARGMRMASGESIKNSFSMTEQETKGSLDS